MKKVFSQYKSLFLVGFIVLLIAGFLVIKNNLSSPATVALISENPSVCHTNIDTFITAEGCGNNTFKVIDTKCKDGRSQKEGNGTSCIDIISAYDRAQAFCGSTCLSSTPSPRPSCVPNPCLPGAVCKLPALTDGNTYCPVPSSPRPSVSATPTASPSSSPRMCTTEVGTCLSKTNTCLRYNDGCAKADFCATPFTPCPTATPAYSPRTTSWPPTPPPTSDPSPLVSCALEVYKIPPTLSLNNAFMTPEYLQRTNAINAKTGERYVINMVLTSLKKYDLSNGNLKLTTWSENILGNAAPYSVYSTSVNNCSSGFPDKSVRCEIPSFPLKANATVRPQTYMVIDTDRVIRPTSTAITFRGIYSASTVSCPSINLTVTPTVNQKCYGIGRFKWCRNVVVN